jgi:hypothetical protein
VEGRVYFTEPLPDNDRRDTHIDTLTDGRDLCNTPLRWAQVPGFITIGSGIRKLMGWGVFTDTGSVEIAYARFNFFKIREVG